MIKGTIDVHLFKTTIGYLINIEDLKTATELLNYCISKNERSFSEYKEKIKSKEHSRSLDINKKK